MSSAAGRLFLPFRVVYHGRVSRTKSLRLTCPDCGSDLVVDARTGAVLSHRRPKEPPAGGKDFDALLDEQTERLQGPPDFYLIHALGAESWAKVRDFGVLAWAERAMPEMFVRMSNTPTALREAVAEAIRIGREAGVRRPVGPPKSAIERASVKRYAPFGRFAQTP